MGKFCILVACRDLKNDDGSSAKVSIIRADSGEEADIGKTKELMGDTPVFADDMFDFECTNPADDLLKVTLMDENDQTRGVGTFNVAEIQKHDKKLAILEMSAGRGSIVVHVMEKVEEGALQLILRAKDLKNTEGFMRKPDPFYVLSRKDGDDWTKVMDSQVLLNTLNPEWTEQTIDVKELCSANLELPLKLEVFDKEPMGKKEVIIGSLETSVKELMGANPDEPLQLSQGDEKCGKIFVETAELAGACVDARDEAKAFFLSVGEALQARSKANNKVELIERLKKESAEAKEAAEAAQAKADKLAKELEEAEGSLDEAMQAATAAEETIGGLE